MFQYQAKGYAFKVIFSDEEYAQMISRIYEVKPNVATFDTETTGLDVLVDTPFLIGIAFNKEVYVFEPSTKRVNMFYLAAADNINYVFAHNAKYDYHMLLNYNGAVPKTFRLVDSMVVARLTEYVDIEDNSIGLDDLGEKYVSKDAKFASSVIKEHLKQINAERWRFAKAELKKTLPRGIAITPIIDAYKDRVQFIPSEYDEHFTKIAQLYKPANYYDSYVENPDLMRSYLADDCVILLEYLRVAIPVLNVVDPDYEVFNREQELYRMVADMERTGMKVDIEYLIASHYKMQAYISQRYNDLWALTGRKFSSGQHNEIKKYFLEAHSIAMESADKKQLKSMRTIYNDTVDSVVSIILELRTLDKWLSTYVDGMLNRVKNGRVHTSINNQGAVTGRVSSDMQQQPKEALEDKDGNELFHPRRAFINDDDSRTFYFDYSQMELRLQAHYTLTVSDGDTNLCRAFMPFKCTNSDGLEFYYNGQQIDGQWFAEDGKVWKKTDLHSVTALKAFPHITRESPDFDHYRRLGKVANFLKNYAGGKDAIMEQLDVDEEMAKKLDSAYYEAFPKVRDYQKWVTSQINTYGFVENIYGRRYYVNNKRFAYKTYNYLIQGGCADLMKEKQVQIYNFMKNKGVKSRILLPIHDELQVSIHKDEEWLVPVIKGIMDDNNQRIPTLPMICDIEVTNSNWADKEDYE